MMIGNARARAIEELNVTVTARTQQLPEQRKIRSKVIVITYTYPNLIGFGPITVRVMNESHRWTAKCGKFSVEGRGTDIDKILESFIDTMKDELNEVLKAIGA